jgi:hypothetical protein
MNKLFEVKTGGLYFKIKDYFTYLLCPCGKMRQRKKKLEKAVGLVYDQLDIVFLLKKIIEVDKLKSLLLN